MHVRSRIVAIGAVGILSAGALGLIWPRVTSRFSLDDSFSSFASFGRPPESPLDGVSSKQTTQGEKCASCHTRAERSHPTWTFLKSRRALGRVAWADASALEARCGACHLLPEPSTLPRQSWREAVARMTQIMEIKGAPKLTALEHQDILHFYMTYSPERFPWLPPDPRTGAGPVKFEAQPLGNPKSEGARPILGGIQLVDLDMDGALDVLVCDTGESVLTWIQRKNGIWKEETLAKVPYPTRAQVVTNAFSGKLDIVVAGQRGLLPSDDPVGIVITLINQGQMRFQPVTILEGVSRIADVGAGDFDADGDLDFLVAAYGFIKEGEIGWLENQANDKYVYRPIVKRAGAIRVIPCEIDEDAPLDFVVLFAQEHEEISAFINRGQGRFQEHRLFKAVTPSFGSSGIELVDLDKDGDLDVLYTNGDNMDLGTMIPRPYHGVQWLENRGKLDFIWHPIHRFYGAYCAVAGDLNHDGHLDIVVTSMFNDWKDPQRASLIWLENNGMQRFKPHGIANQPIHLICAALGDIDGDGRLDIVASGMHAFPPFERMERITLWKNQGP